MEAAAQLARLARPVRLARPLALFCAITAPIAAQARFWREDERVVLSDFSVVEAVAATEARVYVATRNGLASYDRHSRQWAPPVTPLDGYPREQVTVALADPSEDAVWLGTASGVVRYRPMLRTFDAFLVPGGVRDLAFDRDNPAGGIFLRTGSGWELLPPGAFAPAPAAPPPAGRRIQPLDAGGLEARIPYIRTMGPQILLDARLRQFRFTSAALVPGTEEYFLGTNGMGLVRLDALVAQFEPLPLGLLDVGVASLAAVPGGVWAGTDEGSRRPGLTFVADDLQRYQHEEGPRGTGFGASVVRSLALSDGAVWAATDAGLVRVEPGADVQRFQTVDGLPDNEVFALAAGPRAIWAGTARGVAFVRLDSLVVRRLDGPPVMVLSLLASGDSAWAGLVEGLALVVPDGDVLRAPGYDTLPELRGAIVGLAQRGDTLVAATPERLLWRLPEGVWHVGRPLSEVAPIYTVAADDGGLWVGGRNGFLRVRLPAHAVLYRAPGDVPAAVRAVAPAGRYVWIATEAGLVRFTRSVIDR
jgi:ligand-binding sensor domain-containing protein